MKNDRGAHMHLGKAQAWKTIGASLIQNEYNLYKHICSYAMHEHANTFWLKVLSTKCVREKPLIRLRSLACCRGIVHYTRHCGVFDLHPPPAPSASKRCMEETASDHGFGLWPFGA